MYSGFPQFSRVLYQINFLTGDPKNINEVVSRFACAFPSLANKLPTYLLSFFAFLAFTSLISLARAFPTDDYFPNGLLITILDFPRKRTAKRRYAAVTSARLSSAFSVFLKIFYYALLITPIKTLSPPILSRIY